MKVSYFGHYDVLNVVNPWHRLYSLKIQLICRYVSPLLVEKKILKALRKLKSSIKKLCLYKERGLILKTTDLFPFCHWHVK